ncbi:MAG: hypothetical protein ACI9R3_005259 [Verrucomicrobiales bacterium]|jgi:hypothetical protein
MIEETLWGLARALVVAIATVGCGQLVAPVIRSTLVPRWQRSCLALLCLINCFAPALLAGFAYRRWSLTLLADPLALEIAYLVLLVLRIAPVGALLYCLFPSALGDSARHCLAMARVPWLFRLKCEADTATIVFAVATLLAFHEFEIASLTGVDAWTVKLFDAHVGGIPWRESIAMALPPMMVQFVIVGILVRQVVRRFSGGKLDAGFVKRPGIRHEAIAWCAVSLAAVGGALLPLILISAEAVDGVGQLMTSFALRQEILSSHLFALSSGILAFSIASALPLRVLALIAVPGLMGSLTLAMIAVPFFQWERLRGLYDSPVPLVAVLVILLLPFSFLLRALHTRHPGFEARYVANLSGAWHPRWITHGRGALGILCFLCLLAFTDLTASAILAPPGMTTAPARLYNLMHYGQTAVLSAMTLVVFLLPFVIAIGTWCAAEWIVRRRSFSGG